MARELAIQIKVEGTTQAQAALGSVETSIKKVEHAAGSGDAAIDKLKQQFAQTRQELNTLEATVNKGTTSFSSMLSSANVLKVGLMGAGAALAGVLAESARYYVQQSGMMERHQAELKKVEAAWSRFRMTVGEALLGAERDMEVNLSALARYIDRAGTMLARFASSLRSPGGGSPFSAPGNWGFQYGMGIAGTLAMAGQTVNAPGTVARTMDIALQGGAVYPKGTGPGGLPSDLDRIDRAWINEVERWTKQWARDEEKIAESKARFRAAVDKATADWYYGNAAMGGGWSNMGLFPGIPMTQGQLIAGQATQAPLPAYALPGGGMVMIPGGQGVSTGGAGQSWRQQVSGAMPYVTGIAGLVGMFGGSSTIGRVGSGVASGAAAGAMVGSIVPGLGTAIGAGVGALFGGIGSLLGGGAAAQRRKENRQADATIAQLQSQLLDTYGTLENIRMAGDMVGVSLAAAWGDKTVKGLEHFRDMMDEFLKKQDQLQTALEKYGLTWEDLGATAKEFFFQQEAAALLSDFQLLTQAGVDADLLLTKMASSFSLLIQEAIRNGMELPLAMRPMIERLIEMGLLLDEAGNKITDLGVLGWKAGYTAAQGWKEYTDAVEGWQPPEVTIPVRYDRDPNDEVSSGYGASTGGWVTATGVQYFARGGFVPQGTDTVRAMLTPGEYVMSKAAVDRLGIGLLSSLNHGQNLTVNVGGISVDAKHGVWDNPAASQRMADAIADRLMTRVRSQMRWH